MHELRIESLRLVGGGREIEFLPEFTVVKGSITTGKTTLVKLIRSLLGRVPNHLPPETAVIRSILGRVAISDEEWTIERPLVTTKTAMVSLARRERLTVNDRQDENESIIDTLRLPAETATATEIETYQSWILGRLDLPEVAVPRARRDIASPPTPVTINDWLIYCIIRDDEIDTEVFGHRDQFVDRKRRAVFELIYGIYNSEVAELQAAMRSVDLRLADLDRTAEAVRTFLKDTPFSGLDEIDRRTTEATEALARLEETSREISTVSQTESASMGIRRDIAVEEGRLTNLEQELASTTRNVQELRDLVQSLGSQSRRLTRAIVADEWLVDFDFVVCPRCGTAVEGQRTEPDHCYLCLQVPRDGGFHDELVKEQERIASQMVETAELIDVREAEVASLAADRRAISRGLTALNGELDRRTAEFVSVHSDAIATRAADSARLRASLSQLSEYRELFSRFSDLDGMRVSLEEERADLADALGRLGLRSESSLRLIAALEERFLDYLQRLNVSLSKLPLTAKINSTTYLPEVSGRPFDELSSQGLAVLVNVAHALAHHTVAIDHGLPLPGLLVMDGLSNNVGHEGFDLARRDDTYRLLMEEASRYAGRLQIIALDNDVPDFAVEAIVLILTTEDRLIRLGEENTSDDVEPGSQDSEAAVEMPPTGDSS